MAMTMTEVQVEIDRAPERTHVIVRAEGDEFVAEWEGVEYRAGNPFGLDSHLTYAGVPAPRNLYLVEHPPAR